MTTATQTTTDTFVVRPDRDAARRMITLLMVVGALLVPANVLMAVFADSVGDAIFRGASALFWAGLTPYLVRVWRRFIAADALGEIGPSGIRINDLGHGWVSLPWEAVAWVRKDGWGRIVVKPAEGVGPGTPGTEWPSSRSTARRSRRKGLFIYVRRTDAAANQVLAAVTHFSGGRL